MRNRFWSTRLFWGIRLWELTAFVGLHAFLGGMYTLTLWLTASQNQMTGVAVNHAYKLVLTAPFWWLFFRRLAHWPLAKKLLLHFPACALYVFIWIKLFYWTAESAGFGHLWGDAMWWDVFIPMLIYFVQFSCFHVYDFWQQTLKQKEKEKALLQLAHTAELHTLKAQIQPHFLFNTLNSISASVPASEEHTRRLIAQLADVFRFAMRVTDQETIPLEDEITFIRNFLALEQQRFGDRLEVGIDVPDPLPPFRIPPMLLQPLVENALKHGIARSLDGGRVTLSIRAEGERLQFRIADTGAGINGYSAEQLFVKGIGLENTRQRLQRIYGAALNIRSQAPRGTLVSFALPMEH